MSLEKKILNFLKENPGANAREIAEALGSSYSRVQSTLYRLREKGVIVKTGFGYAVSSVREAPITYEGEYEEKRYTISRKELNEFLEKIKELENKINNLLIEYRKLSEDIKSVTEKVKGLHDEVQGLKKKLNEVYGKIKDFHVKRKGVIEDKLLSKLRKEGVIDISIARNLTLKSIEEYVRAGTVIVLSSLVVSKEFYEEFKKKFPIPKDKVKDLSEKEKALLRALVDEGLAYLYRGVEYRLV